MDRDQLEAQNLKVKRRTPAGRIQNGLTARVVSPGRDGQRLGNDDKWLRVGFRLSAIASHAASTTTSSMPSTPLKWLKLRRGAPTEN